MTTAPLKVDWHTIHLEFINGAMTLADLATRHGINAATIRARAKREHWQDERHKLQRTVTANAVEQQTHIRAQELVKVNQDDLKLAKELRAQIKRHVQDAQDDERLLSPGDIRTLTVAAEAAQRMGRLALGISTENHQHTGVGNGPIPTLNGNATVPKALYEECLKRALDQF